MGLLDRIGRIIKAEISARIPDRSSAHQASTDAGYDSAQHATKSSAKSQTRSPYSEQELQYYANLEVAPGSSFADIKKSYRRLLAHYHPDRYHDDVRRQDAEELTRRLNEAYAFFEQQQRRKT